MLLLKKTHCLCLWLPVSACCEAKPQELTLRPETHIALLGNGLAEGFQRDGWLETFFQARFPERHLSFRNLGFTGDEVTQRLRCENFGTPDEWLTRTKTDVVFAFFGYNESFAGKAGLDKFKQELARFVQETRQHRYNGADAAQVVLFSPIAQENLRNPNLPDGSANNPNIKLYATAIAEVARQAGVPFVDLFAPSLELYSKSAQHLTSDGIHLNEVGHQKMAAEILRALFPNQKSPNFDPAKLEKVREAVVDKDFYWFNRYRTVDGNNVYGGRSQLKYVDQVSNWDVLQREMEVLDRKSVV